MKITTVILTTNAVKRGDTFIEAIQSHLEFSDDMIVVDGGSTDGTIEAIEALHENRIRIEIMKWADNWVWDEFPKHMNRGYDLATGDWVIPAETDHLIHEDDGYSKIRVQLEEIDKHNFAYAFLNKQQSSLWNKWGSKAQYPYFYNKKRYGDKIRFGLDKDKNSDLLYPLWVKDRLEVPEGRLLEDNEMTQLSCDMWNYQWTFKTWDMILTERIKAAHGWNAYTPFQQYHHKTFPSDLDKIKEWLSGEMLTKHERNKKDIPLEKHPKFIQKRLKEDLKQGMFGYDLCGLLEGAKNANTI